MRRLAICGAKVPVKLQYQNTGDINLASEGEPVTRALKSCRVEFYKPADEHLTCPEAVELRLIKNLKSLNLSRRELEKVSAALTTVSRLHG
jgi:hypothetical protein